MSFEIELVKQGIIIINEHNDTIGLDLPNKDLKKMREFLEASE